MSKEINSNLALMGFKLNCVFVPFSKSRNKDEKNPSLNWLVTLIYNDRPVLTTDYMAGCAHCPSYKQGKPDMRLVREECETGFPMRESGIGFWKKSNVSIVPDLANFLYGIITDSDCLNYSDFVEWAETFGYDPDSIAAKKIYDSCMEIALQYHNRIPNETREDVAKQLEDF